LSACKVQDETCFEITESSSARGGWPRGYVRYLVFETPDAQRPTCPVWRRSRGRALGRSGGLAEGLEEPAHLVLVAYEPEDAHPASTVRAREGVDAEGAERFCQER